jgi:outer membrane biosynthesis protein TonB
MSRKERVVAAIKRVIAAERVLAGILLAVAVAGAVLIPRLLVGPSPQHELGVGAPSMTGPPVVLAPGLPAQRSQPQAAAGPQSHVTHAGVVPSAGTSQPAAQPRPATSPAVHGPPPRTQPLPQPQPPTQPNTPPTPRALAPTPLAAKTTTCNGTFSGTGKDVVVPSGATCVLVHGTAITHDLTVSPGGTLIDPAVTVGHDLVAHSPAGISIDGGSVGHDLRIEGLSGSAGVQNRICNTTVGHDLVVEGNANAVALAGNSVGHDLRVGGATASRHAAPKPPKPHHEPKLSEPPKPPKPQDKPKPQHTPPPKPVHQAEQHASGHGH